MLFNTTRHRNLEYQNGKHISNTDEILAFLSKNEFVKEVIHPSLDNHPDYNLSKKLYSKGISSIINFSLKGGFDSGKKFIDSLSLFSHLANIGDAKSLVIHPASTTHFRMSKKELKILVYQKERYDYQLA